jgi:hypothetical protein
MEKVRKNESGGTGTDDGNLRSLRHQGPSESASPQLVSAGPCIDF